MAFLIPYVQLSPEQKDIVIRISRENKDLFVEGPPGSGKTLISLYTISNMIEEKAVKPLLLMYNHSLYGYLRASMEELEITDNITIATKDKFFWDLARQYDIYPEKSKEYMERYDSILKKLVNCQFEKLYDVTVVDEVQDLHPNEWVIIKKLSKQVTTLGDFNQGIYETNLTKQQIVGNGMMETLSKIFRFHRNIAKLAALFSRTNDNLENKVSKSSQVVPKFIDVKVDEEYQNIKDILNNLKNRRERIGVIGPDRGKLYSLANYLNKNEVEVDIYKTNKELGQHDFTSTKPLLITSHSSKGLEFEHVIIFGFDKGVFSVNRLRDEGRLKDILYVSITRTNSNLYIIRTPNCIEELKGINLFENKEAEGNDGGWF